MEISICLTDLGELTLSSNVNIYSNSDNFTTPIYTNIPVSNLYTPNCSFTATVPSGTTILQINDPIINCNTFINVLSSDFCNDCNLRFDVFSSNTVSQIVAGLLIDDCTGTTITDYIIDWYGPNSTTNVQYTSGYGTAFSGFSFTHPLTGAQAIFAQSGSFFPQVRFIKINGIIYSQTGGTGSYLADLNSCLSANTVNVSPFDCTNGVSSNPDYTHEVLFTANASGVPPAPLQASVILSSTTKYFAWAFSPEEIPDTLTLTFYGSAYSDPIVFESICVGSGNQLASGPVTFDPNTITKSARTNNDDFYIKKVNVLTGLTINDGDEIVIDIIPNANNTATNWSLLFNSCLTTFDCTNCLTSTSPTEPVWKISGSTINIFTGSCDSSYISYAMSGCGKDTLVTTDVFKYIHPGNNYGTPLAYPSWGWNTFQNPYSPYGQYNIPNTSTLSTSTVTFVNQTTSCYINGPYYGYFCSTSNNNYIRYVKSNTGVGGTGLLKMYFSNVNDFNTYIVNINYWLNYLITGSLSIPPYSPNPADCEHFRNITISVPKNITGNNPCGDTHIPEIYQIHVSTTVTTGFTSGIYEIELTMPTINNLYPQTNCDNCWNVIDNNIFNIINSSSTGTTNVLDVITNRGSRYVTPVTYRYLSCVPGTRTTWDTYAWWNIPNYINETYMYSGTPLTLIPALTAKTCDFTGVMSYNPTGTTITNNNYFRRSLWKYQFTILTPSINMVDFKIQTYTFVSGDTTNSLIDIYIYSGGTVVYSDPTYII